MEQRRWADACPPRPWSTNELRRPGTGVTAGAKATNEVTFRDLTAWNNRLIFHVEPRVREAAVTELAGSGEVRLGSRAKSLETVRDKLVRDAHRPLQNIQDLAGVRVIANMTLSQQA